MIFDETFFRLKIDETLFLIKYHPEGGPETSICGVAKDLK
jgi:hypothetical protein